MVSQTCKKNLMNALKRCEGWCVRCGLHQAAKTATASQTTDILFKKTIQLQGKPMMKAMWGQWIRQPISASVISNSFIGKLVCLEGLWWNWSSWIHCAVEQFLGNSPNIKSKSFHTRKSPTVTSWGWRCRAKFLSHFGLFSMSLSIIILSWMSSEKSSSTLATGIAGESRLFKHKEVKSWLMPTWFAQSCPTRLSFMINDSNMFWRCANLDLPSFTANSMNIGSSEHWRHCWNVDN